MMAAADVVGFASRSLGGQRTRSALIVLAMSIGVAAVIVLVTLGEGARSYVRAQFSRIGSNLLIVLPGRAETSGGSPGMLLGETPRPLTLDDALALARSPAVRRLAPLVVGSGLVAWGGRSREVPVVGSTADFLAIRDMRLEEGRFLPGEDPRAPAPVCVLGATLREEIFGETRAVGEWVRIGDRRFRVTGVLAAQGQSLGMDSDEIAVIPVASAQMLFDTDSMFRVLVEARSRESMPRARDDLVAILRERHEGEEDVTVLGQDAVVATFDRVLRTLTLAVAGIAAVSLGVAGILVMNVMLVAVSQRTAEIGLLKSLGASGAQVRNLFFAEAAVLSAAGGTMGLATGLAGAFVVGRAYPAIRVLPPVWAVGSALLVAVVTGVAFAVLPARRAARLDAVEALGRR